MPDMLGKHFLNHFVKFQLKLKQLQNLDIEINNKWKTLCLFISQSGETADTIAALKLAKSCGAKTIAISNVIGSSISREADYTVYTHAGPEIAVASTKAYTAQIALLAIIAINFAEILEINEEKVNELKKIFYFYHLKLKKF